MNKTSVAIAVVRSAEDQRFISNEKDDLFDVSLTIAPTVHCDSISWSQIFFQHIEDVVVVLEPAAETPKR
jgi:hypothetical protein